MELAFTCAATSIPILIGSVRYRYLYVRTFAVLTPRPSNNNTSVVMFHGAAVCWSQHHAVSAICSISSKIQHYYQAQKGHERRSRTQKWYLLPRSRKYHCEDEQTELHTYHCQPSTCEQNHVESRETRLIYHIIRTAQPRTITNSRWVLVQIRFPYQQHGFEAAQAMLFSITRRICLQKGLCEIEY